MNQASTPPELEAALAELRQAYERATPGAVVTAKLRKDRGGRLDQHVEISTTTVQSVKVNDRQARG